MLDWPEGLHPSSQTLHVRYFEANFASGFGPKTQRQGRPRLSRWVGQMSFSRKKQADTQAFEALVALLLENGETVRVPLFRTPAPIGAAKLSDQGVQVLLFQEGFGFAEGFGFSRTPAVFAKAAAQGVSSLTLVGFVPNEDAFAPGDVFELQAGRSYKVKSLTPVRANSEGEVAVPISPPLREAVTAGQEVRLTLCGVKAFVRVTPETGAAMTRKPLVSDFTLSIEEDPN